MDLVKSNDISLTMLNIILNGIYLWYLIHSLFNMLDCISIASVYSDKDCCPTLPHFITALWFTFKDFHR